MSILSDYLAEREDPSKAREQLRQIATELKEVMHSDDLSEEEQYDLVFRIHNKVVKPLLEEANLCLEYYDPDTTYQEDAWAYVNALKELVQ